MKLKQTVFSALALSSVLLIAACGNEMVQQKEEIDAAQVEVQTAPATVGIIDDVTAERILVTVEQTDTLNKAMKGQRIYFTLDALSDEEKQSLQRGQKVKVEHGDTMSMSNPPSTSAEAIELVDLAMSEQPHVAIFKYDEEAHDYLRKSMLTGASVASIEMVLEDATWTDGTLENREDATYQFSIETANSPFKSEDIYMVNHGKTIDLYNSATGQKATIEGGMTQRLVELIK